MDWNKAFTFIFLNKKGLFKNLFLGGFVNFFTIAGFFLLICAGLLFWIYYISQNHAVTPLMSIGFGLGELVLFVLSLICPTVLMGYSLLVAKNTNLSIETILPDWKRDFKQINLYCIDFCNGFTVILGIILVSFAIPLIIGAVLGKIVFAIVLLLEIIAGIILGIILWILYNAMCVNFIYKNSFKAVFNIKELCNIIKFDFVNYAAIIAINIIIVTLGSTLISPIVLVIAGILASPFALCLVIQSIIPIVAPIVALLTILGFSMCLIPIFYAQLVNAHLLGQYAKKYIDSLEKQGNI